jgi:hypothetical protein
MIEANKSQRHPPSNEGIHTDAAPPATRSGFVTFFTIHQSIVARGGKITGLVQILSA